MNNLEAPRTVDGVTHAVYPVHQTQYATHHDELPAELRPALIVPGQTVCLYIADGFHVPDSFHFPDIRIPDTRIPDIRIPDNSALPRHPVGTPDCRPIKYARCTSVSSKGE